MIQAWALSACVSSPEAAGASLHMRAEPLGQAGSPPAEPEKQGTPAPGPSPPTVPPPQLMTQGEGTGGALPPAGAASRGRDSTEHGRCPRPGQRPSSPARAPPATSATQTRHTVAGGECLSSAAWWVGTESDRVYSRYIRVVENGPGAEGLPWVAH